MTKHTKWERPTKCAYKRERAGESTNNEGRYIQKKNIHRAYHPCEGQTTYSEERYRRRKTSTERVINVRAMTKTVTRKNDTHTRKVLTEHIASVGVRATLVLMNAKKEKGHIEGYYVIECGIENRKNH